MAIHHSQLKKAEKAGYSLSEQEEGGVRAFWPKRALPIYGSSAADAMAQMQAAMAILGSDDEFRIPTPLMRLIAVYRQEDNKVLVGSPMPPVAAHSLIFGGKAEWQDPEDAPEGDELAEGNPEAPEDDGPFDEGADTATSAPNSDTSDVSSKTIERINGIAIDGAVAFREGTPAGDCPYSSETEDEEEYANFEKWNEDWDAAADEASEEDEGKGGSVVSAKYRAKYAEAGHPTHCGDWLAETLNEICLNKEGVNLELFEGICALNGVDTSKYKRSGVGWQGRIRMTGRNLMSKKVYLNEGKLILPESMGGFKQAPAEWMAQQRFKAAAK